MSPARNPALIIGGLLSVAAALLHIGCIIGGPDWYRFFGAGEAMATLAEQGSMTPTPLTLGIAGILAIWAAYAFSGAGLLPRLPLLRTGLVVISAVYPFARARPDPGPSDQRGECDAVHPVEFADRPRLRDRLCGGDLDGLVLPLARCGLTGTVRSSSLARP